ncbi:MAG TPA: ZIP family metal transporter [Bacteroidia bacterium]|nr:ZIP family metal transporter [Bacteroidia bacterium]
MKILSYLLLFFSIVLSGASVFAFKKINKKALKLLLAFSGAFLFALTVMHLIPGVYEAKDHSIGAYILLGFFIQILLEIFSEGIEHGHMHIHKHENAAFPYGMMIGLCLHSFLEGIPLVQRFNNESVEISLLAGIILHHIPVAIALTTMLLDSGISRARTLLFLMIFAAMAPAGAWSSNLLNASSSIDISMYYDKLMAIVIGIFLHISTTILFESSEGHRFNYFKFFVILLGAALVFLV